MPFVKFEQSVLPMFSAIDDGHPKRTGSCVLIHYRSRPFVVTAKHTLENNPVAIHVGRSGSKLIPLPIGGFYTTDAPDALDIAVAPLSPDSSRCCRNKVSCLSENLAFISMLTRSRKPL